MKAIARANLYAEAGADCIYPIGPGDRETLSVLRHGITSPINALAAPGSASLDVMREIGVNRVSCGPFIFRSCMKKFVYIIDTLQKSGDFDCFSDAMLGSTETGEFLRAESESA